MISIPCPDQSWMKRLAHFACAVLFLAAITPVQAADKIHHLKIERPAKAAVGDTVEIVVTAHREDGSLIKDARVKLDMSITTRESTVKKEIKMVSGRGTIRLSLNNAGSHLIWIKDPNSDLKLSSSIKVAEVLK